MNFKDVTVQAPGLITERDGKPTYLGKLRSATRPAVVDGLAIAFTILWESSSKALVGLEVISPEGGVISAVRELLKCPEGFSKTIHRYQMPEFKCHTPGVYRVRVVGEHCIACREFEVVFPARV